MKVRIDTIPDRFPALKQELARQNRIDTALWWIGAILLPVALLTIITLFIGLGNMAAVVAQIGAGQ